MNKTSVAYPFVLAVLCLAFSLAFTGCGGGSSPEGMWTGQIDGFPVSLVFSGNLCFVVYEGEVDGVAEYTFDKGSGALVVDGDLFTFTIKGKNLDFEFAGMKLPLIKDTTIKTPAAINGLWKAKRNWAFAFLGDKVYILDEDEDGIVGTYTLDNNKGSIECDWYDFDFAIVGNDMVVTGDEEMTLTKMTK
jgi:hypothetical protein